MADLPASSGETPKSSSDIKSINSLYNYTSWRLVEGNESINLWVKYLKLKYWKQHEDFQFRFSKALRTLLDTNPPNRQAWETFEATFKTLACENLDRLGVICPPKSGILQAAVVADEVRALIQHPKLLDAPFRGFRNGLAKAFYESAYQNFLEY
ncbi:hypothetical protein Cpir12675_003093 [Ceratocystis pirilliformis]|uniref:Uncharacterized protein n=1 Tax=Ceratocystis pirilliformis TaxID=259994 RepID=A0ABR3Z603_9PEZI